MFLARAGVGWLLLTAAAGCFDPAIPACLACDGVCPEGLRCVEGRCVAPGESCEPQRKTDCNEARCCIGDACFERADGATYTIAAWLDWTRITTEDATFAHWDDRTGHGHTARPQRPDEPPVLQRAGFADRAEPLLTLRSGTDYLVLDEPSGAPLAQLGRGDFYVLLALGMDCERTSRTCPLRKVSQPARGFMVAIEEDGSVQTMAWTCTGAERDCIVRLESAPGLARCGRTQLIGVRRANSEGPDSRLELRMDGRVEVAAALGPGRMDADRLLYVGGSPNCEHFTGIVAAMIAIEGAMTDREACELEGTVQRALTTAGLSEEAPRGC